MSNAVDIFLRGVRFNPACHKGVRVDLRTVKASKDLEHEFGAFVTDENEEAQAVREAMERGLDVTNDLYGVPHAI